MFEAVKAGRDAISNSYVPVDEAPLLFAIQYTTLHKRPGPCIVLQRKLILQSLNATVMLEVYGSKAQHSLIQPHKSLRWSSQSLPSPLDFIPLLPTGGIAKVIGSAIGGDELCHLFPRNLGRSGEATCRFSGGLACCVQPRLPGDVFHAVQKKTYLSTQSISIIKLIHPPGPSYVVFFPFGLSDPVFLVLGQCPEPSP